VQDRCTVCAKRNTDSKIVLGALNGTTGDVGHVESYFGPFRDADNLDAR
jgi:hypothetical protein